MNYAETYIRDIYYYLTRAATRTKLAHPMEILYQVSRVKLSNLTVSGTNVLTALRESFLPFTSSLVVTEKKTMEDFK